MDSLVGEPEHNIQPFPHPSVTFIPKTLIQT